MRRLSSEQKENILRLKKINWSWDDIAIATNVSTNTCRSFWKRHRKIADLPPPVRVIKRSTDGLVGLEIKRIIAAEPTLSIRKIKQCLMVKFGTSPSFTTIRKFLHSNSMVWAAAKE